MHFELLLEEPSAEAALGNILPKIIPNHTWRFLVFSGKRDLMENLEGIFRGYKSWIPDDYRIVVLIDQDGDDCRILKHTMDAMATSAGLNIKSKGSPFQVLNRIAIEELEAWFLGDPNAVRAAFPKVSKSFEKRENYRRPDEIRGGTWESLERLLQSAGYYSSGLPKIETAGKISQYMVPQINVSPSFIAFVAGLNACLD